MRLTAKQQLIFSSVLLTASFLVILRAASLSRPKRSPKATYRVRYIPGRYGNREDCRFLLETILSTSEAPCRIIIRTFASTIGHRQNRSATSRVVTFDLVTDVPSKLHPNAQNEWNFKSFDFKSKQTDEYLIIDTHFNGFTILSSPEDQGESHEFDLVAISGLGSHAWGSFKKRSESSMWLADKLPRNWPRARIMIYGYHSPIMGSHSRKNLADIAKRFGNELINIRNSLNVSPRSVPLIFLAHSLGGLVVKQALVNLSRQSRTEPDTQEPFHSTRAILFFGVPCKGLDGERLGLAAMARGQSTEGFLTDLRDNSLTVDTLSQNFLKVFQNRHEIQIFSFYETVESATAVMSFGRPSMSGPKKHWVGKAAAFNGRDIEREEDDKYSIPLDTDHSGLVKCENEETFTTICNVLKDLDWASSTRAITSYKKQGGEVEAVSTPGQSAHPRYYQVDGAVEYFMGRDDFIQKIHTKLGNPSVFTPSIAIWGLSGIGKTETVLAYAARYHSQYSTICLFNARSEKDLTSSMASFFEFLAQRSDTRLTKMSGYASSDKWKAVKRWLEEESHWLAIYDDVDLEPEYNFRSYLPQHCDGHRILIGQSRAAMKFADDELEMTGMSDNDAVNMLLKRAGFSKPTMEEKQDATRIVYDVDKIPSSIEYAAADIRESQCSLKVYLEILRKQKENMPSGHAGFKHGDMRASWEVSYNKLQKDHKSSMLLLRLFAFLDGSCISTSLLNRGSSNRTRWSGEGEKVERSPDWSLVDKAIWMLLQDPVKLNLALVPLLNASFVRRERNGTIKMPKLVQRLVILRLDVGELLIWTKKAICFVSHSFPEEAYLEQPFETLRSELTPHVFRCMDHARKFLPVELYDVTFQLVSMILSVLAGSWRQMELVDYAKLFFEKRNNVYYCCLAAKWEAYMLWDKEAFSDAAALLSRTRHREEIRLATTGTTTAEAFLKGDVADYRGHAAIGDLTIHQAQFLFKSGPGYLKEAEMILKRWKARSTSELELRTQLYINTALAKNLLCQVNIPAAVEILERLVLVPEAHGTGMMQPEKYNWGIALLAQSYCALGRFHETIDLLLPEVTFRIKGGLESEFITSDYRLLLAEAYVQTHQYQEAAEILAKLEIDLGHALQVDNPRAHGQLVSTKSLRARSLYLQKLWKPAQTAWIEFLACLSVDEADILDLIWKRNYNTRIGIFSLAMVYYHLGKTEKADQFVKIIEPNTRDLVHPADEIDYTKWSEFLRKEYENVTRSWVSWKWRAWWDSRSLTSGL